MAIKKKPQKKKQEPVFLGIVDNSIVFSRKNLELASGAASEYINQGRADTVTIVCVVGAWVSEIPPEPEVEVSEMDLSELEFEDA